MQPKTLKLRMLTEGPNKNHKPGDIIEVDPTRAAVLMLGDHAEPVDKPRRSTIKTGEKAVIHV